MGALLDFFGGGPARIQALLIGALVAAAACLALAGYGLWWRAEAYQARAERDVAVAQGKVLVGAVNRCSASVERAATAGEAALNTSRELLAQAERLSAGGKAQVARIQQLLDKGAPAGAGCEDAWRAIELNRKAGGP